MDDILDYEAGEGTLGKPGGADLRLGLATGPALFAWEEHPEMGPLIKRKFEQPGDVELVRLPANKLITHHMSDTIVPVPSGKRPCEEIVWRRAYA